MNDDAFAALDRLEQTFAGSRSSSNQKRVVQQHQRRRTEPLDRIHIVVAAINQHPRDGLGIRARRTQMLNQSRIGVAELPT